MCLYIHNIQILNLIIVELTKFLHEESLNSKYNWHIKIIFENFYQRKKNTYFLTVLISTLLYKRHSIMFEIKLTLPPGHTSFFRIVSLNR